MKKIKDINNLRRIQVGILKCVHNICEKNGLVYFLCAGSLLGAVRHKGYIPWDDDIDIMMPRNDYEKLIKIINLDKISPFHMITYKNCPGFGRAFAKVSDSRTAVIQKGFFRIKNLGVNIDVFPYDGLPSSKEKISTQYKKTIMLRRHLHTLTQNSGDATKRIPKWRLPFVFIFCFYLDSITKKYSVNTSNNVTCYTVVSLGKTEIIERSIFEERTLADFEGEKFYIIKKYGQYLTQHFGDYMKLPPVSQRRNKHGVIAWHI